MDWNTDEITLTWRNLIYEILVTAKLTSLCLLNKY